MVFPFKRIALIGFGEVGGLLARDLKAAGAPDLASYDIAFADAASRQAEAARAAGVPACPSCALAVAGADLVISAVTAGSDLDAARAAAPHLLPGAFFLDVNSVSPNTKRQAADIIDAAGGRYVEAAVMSSYPPRGMATPKLLGGPHAAAFIAAAAGLGLDVRVYSEQVGAASSVKMCRSVLIKGMEALFLESMLSARHYGVVDDVLASLKDTLPGIDTGKMARYMISRALIHGRRRAEEVREVAKTVADAGLEPMLSSPIARRQDWAADRGRGIAADILAEADLAVLLAAVADAG